MKIPEGVRFSVFTRCPHGFLFAAMDHTIQFGMIYDQSPNTAFTCIATLNIITLDVIRFDWVKTEEFQKLKLAHE